MLCNGYLCLNGMIIPHEMMKVYPSGKFQGVNIACQVPVRAYLSHIVAQFTQQV